MTELGSNRNTDSIGAEAPHILIVDDEPIIREILLDLLSSQGYVVHQAENGAVALEKLMRKSYHLVMTDLKMPVMSGSELIATCAEKNIKSTFIVMTAYATIETAIQTMKNGAYDYIMKPFKIDEIIVVAQRALEKERLERENIKLKEVKRLYEISEAMSSTLSLDRLLQIIVQSAKKEVEADVVSLVLWHPEEKRWYSEICDTDIPGLSSEELDNFIDLEAIKKAHNSNLELLFPPMDLTPFMKNNLKIKAQVNSFVSIPLASQGKLTGMLNVFSFSPGQIFVKGQRKSLYILGSRAANVIENARLHEELKIMFQQTIEGFAYAIDAKDSYTLGHSRRVTQYCERIAYIMGLEEKEVERIRNAAVLHDIGKIGLRLEALNKPEPLSREERKVVETHPQMGCKILRPIFFFDRLIPIIYHHHEHYNGRGYPEGKEGEQIPLGARIIAAADAYDAMTSDRPYRKAMTSHDAIKELYAYSGTQFDPEVIKAFIAFLHEQPRFQVALQEIH